MKKIHRIIIFVVLMTTIINRCHSQERLILNGAIINISTAGFIVIDNPSSSGIIRNSGHIISEGENNRIKWNTGVITGTYTIPWGYGSSNYIPLTFTKTSGAGGGSFIISTYHTPTWQNSAYLPTGVSNVSSASGAADNSAKVIDRFWMINATGYTNKPAISNLNFAYLDVEHATAANTINEGNLKAQRYNSNLNKWGDYVPAGIDNQVTNTVTVTNVTAPDLFMWWTLVDNTSPLPIQLVSFTGKCENSIINLQWSTATETNNDYFTLEKSSNATTWKTIATVKGAGNSSQILNYTATDEMPSANVNYYRLKQTDYNGNFTYSAIIAVASCKAASHVTMYPNPANEYVELSLDASWDEATIRIFNKIGEVVLSEKLNTSGGLFKRINTSELANGIYTIVAQSSTDQFTSKLVVRH